MAEQHDFSRGGQNDKWCMSRFCRKTNQEFWIFGNDVNLGGVGRFVVLCPFCFSHTIVLNNIDVPREVWRLVVIRELQDSRLRKIIFKEV